MDGLLVKQSETGSDVKPKEAIQPDIEMAVVSLKNKHINGETGMAPIKDGSPPIQSEIAQINCPIDLG